MGTLIAEDVFTCERCETTILCTRSALVSQFKWKMHVGYKDGKQWHFLLCDERQPKDKETT